MIRDYKLSEVSTFDSDDAKGVKLYKAIGEKDGASNFVMRVFEIKPGGQTPFHSHEWEHEVFILEGKGVLVTDSESHTFKPGDAVFIKPYENHQFKADKDCQLRFICCIPSGMM